MTSSSQSDENWLGGQTHSLFVIVTILVLFLFEVCRFFLFVCGLTQCDQSDSSKHNDQSGQSDQVDGVLPWTLVSPAATVCDITAGALLPPTPS